MSPARISKAKIVLMACIVHHSLLQPLSLGISIGFLAHQAAGLRLSWNCHDQRVKSLISRCKRIETGKKISGGGSRESIGLWIKILLGTMRRHRCSRHDSDTRAENQEGGSAS